MENILYTNKKLKIIDIAIPVVQEQQEDDLFHVSDDDDFFDQDPEDLEHDIETSHEWKNLINEWIEMVSEEAEIDQEEETNEDLEPLIDQIMDLDWILCKQHLLINKRAKWKLGDIFDFEKLQPPEYLTLLKGYSNID
ncbi:hypothetical protein RclHR1_09860017 [Rhizophagus clarus]|uniref:Uncharacterized protein n=1 Tax=Rhizophagus clarus TaxID=94130 RepID=A0A2Z6SIH9_9GLOM|nr:hypothetical protein RclHR1_09860017 [Rhizophagus clarus]GES95242.1 hypothetical protein GLOIN_2v1663593 [Rhizophagus clarus]